MTTDKRQALQLVATSAGFRHDFPGWIDDNWHVYQEFERLCLFAAKRDRPRVSAKFLFGLIRSAPAAPRDLRVSPEDVGVRRG